jgi:hypothetical protein
MGKFEVFRTARESQIGRSEMSKTLKAEPPSKTRNPNIMPFSDRTLVQQNRKQTSDHIAKMYSSTDDMSRLIGFSCDNYTGNYASKMSFFKRHDFKQNNLSCKRVEDGPPEEEEVTEPSSVYLITGLH